LSSSSWGEEDLKNPEKHHEMTVLLNAQREISEKILDVQWETKWRQEKVGDVFSFHLLFVCLCRRINNLTETCPSQAFSCNEFITSNSIYVQPLYHILCASY
jgi:hypothetical protein